MTTTLMMKKTAKHLKVICGTILATTLCSSLAIADPLFTDDFEDRVRDQVLVGPGWTWYNQAYTDDQCTEYSSGFGPFDDGDGSDYLQENRNYWTASEDVGQGNSYFRAGLEVPAWATDEGDMVVLGNMLRVYGDQYYNPPGEINCKRTLVFQELTVEAAGTFTFSFDVAMDRVGAPAFGETTAAFVKVIKTSDLSYNEILFENLETDPPLSTTPENASTSSHEIDFTVTEEMVGELLQFGFYNDHSPSLGQSVDTSAALYDNIVVAPMEIGPGHSGSYFNTGQSGHGFSIEFGMLGDSPFGVVYWYIYDDAGNPIFMVGNGVPVGQEIVINLESPVGMVYGDFDPTTVDREVGGVAVFNFSDRNNATFSYTPSAFSETNWGHTPIVDLPLVKAFGIPADNNFPSSQ